MGIEHIEKLEKTSFTGSTAAESVSNQSAQIGSVYGFGFPKSSSKTDTSHTTTVDQEILGYAQILFSDDKNKVNNAFDKYFSDDPKYSKLSKDGKSKFIKKELQKLEKYVSSLNIKSGNKELHDEMIVFLLAYSKVGNKSIDEICSMDKNTLQSNIKNIVFKYYDILAKNIDGYENMTNEEKVYAAADFYLSKTDENYNAQKDENVKKEQCTNFINKVLSGALAMDVHIERLDAKKLFEVLNVEKIRSFDEDAAEFFAKNGTDINECKEKDYSRYCKLYAEYLKQQKANGKINIDDAKLDEFSAYADLMVKTGKSNPTYKDILDVINNIPEAERTPIQKKIKEKIELTVKNDKSNPDKINEQVNIDSMELSLAGIVSDNMRAPMEVMLSSVEEIDSKEGFSKASKIMQQMAGAFVNDIGFDSIEFNEKLKIAEQNIRQIGKARGWSEEKINALIQEFKSGIDAAKAAANATVSGRDRSTGQISDFAYSMGQRDTSHNIIVNGQEHINETAQSDEERRTRLAEQQIGLGNNQELQEVSWGHMRETFDSKIVNGTFDSLMQTPDISPSVKSSNSRTFVTSGRDDNEKYEAGKYLTDHYGDDKYVMEGAASAANSISDENIKNGYSANIQEAIKNYQPEDRAVINQALQTGQISSQTLAQTTPSASALSYRVSTPVQREVNNITSYTSTLGEKDTTKAYLSYLDNVTRQLEQKRDIAAENAKETKEHIEDSQKAEEIKQAENLYYGFSEQVIKELAYAYNYSGGASGVYAKLGELNYKDAQASFLVYFAQNASMTELRTFAMKYGDDAQVMQAICTYGNVSALPADLIVKCIEKGWINISNISDLNSILSEQKNNLSFLRRIYDATKNVQIFALNFDLLTEYISLGKINPAILPASLYQRYKNSLSPFEQQRLEQALEQGKLALGKEENDGAQVETGLKSDIASEISPNGLAKGLIPGSPQFYAELNKQSDKYNPSNYVTTYKRLYLNS